MSVCASLFDGSFLIVLHFCAPLNQPIISIFMGKVIHFFRLAFTFIGRTRARALICVCMCSCSAPFRARNPMMASLYGYFRCHCCRCCHGHHCQKHHHLHLDGRYHHHHQKLHIQKQIFLEIEHVMRL